MTHPAMPEPPGPAATGPAIPTLPTPSVTTPSIITPATTPPPPPTIATTPANRADPTDPTVVLEASGVFKSFGGLKAVQDFRLTLRAGDLQGLIGPNGAGKTTVFNLLTGVYKPDRGRIFLRGREVQGLKPSAIAALGVARTFQNIRLFGELSVLDNVMLAGHVRTRQSMLASILRTPAAAREEAELAARARDLLDLFDLRGREEEQARNLPYGDQRRLEIARALATGPAALLLDEPAAGMNPQEKRDLAALIRAVRGRFRVSILLIEHDMGLVMEICEHLTVLDYGVVIATGSPASVQADPRVIEAYLGAAGEEEPQAREEKRHRDLPPAAPILPQHPASGAPDA